MLADVAVGADALVAIDEVEAGSAVPTGAQLAVVGVELAVPALEAWWTGAGIAGAAGHAGGGVLAGVGRANVKVGLELAVVAVEAGLASTLVLLITARLKKYIYLLLHSKISQLLGNLDKKFIDALRSCWGNR